MRWGWGSGVFGGRRRRDASPLEGSEVSPPPPRHRSLPRTVVALGFVSLFNDLASEMVTPLVPILLATVLGAGPVVLGAIEGGADALSNLLKLWAGRRSDLLSGRRKPFVAAGYALSNVVRPLIALSGSWGTVLAVRLADRVGKGVRAAPRDALIGDAVEDDLVGRAYGFTRALDHTGAFLGALAAAAVLSVGGIGLGSVIALSAIPGLLAVSLAVFGVSDRARRPPPPERHPPPSRWHSLDPRLRRYLLLLGLFALGRIPETFLLLRGHEIGLGVVELLFLWAAFSAVKSLASESSGRLADRYGRRPVILAGWSLYALAVAGLGLSGTRELLWSWALVTGLHFGACDAAERALVRDLAPAGGRGTSFGWYHMVVGLAAIPAGVTLGALWTLHGVTAAFLASAGVTAAAAAGFWRLVR